MRRIMLTLLLAAGLTLPAVPAFANPFTPPAGELWAGLTGGNDAREYSRQVAHPPVFQFFTAWDEPTGWIFDRARAARARPMLSISTTGGGPERISPQGIAAGRGDGYLLALNRGLAAYGGIGYVRLMAEMDGYWNPYCAFGPDGRSRGASHSTAEFRRAWRRSVTIVRGGPLAAVDRRLAALGLPPVHGAGGDLPRPRVAFLWVPQVAGAPDTAANAPRAYWPGRRWVDWVGTDFYSRYPNFAGLERFYRAYGTLPFAFGEWAIWGRDDPAFVRGFLGWVGRHPRVRMILYNQGNNPVGPFRLSRYPASAGALRAGLRGRRFPAYAPELRP